MTPASALRPVQARGLFVASLGVGYLAASLGYLLTLRPAGVVFLWPPSGIMLAALVLLPRACWLPILLGGLVGNVAADMQHGASAALAFAGSAVNALEQALAAAVFLRFAGPAARLNRLREVGALVVGSVIVSNAVTALLGAVILNWYSPASFWRGWLSWWTGDGMGMLILTPVVLTWVDAARRRGRVSVGLAAEAVALVASTAALAAWLLTRPPGSTVDSAHAYLVFPLLIWAGVRLGPVGAATATLGLTVVAAGLAMNGTLPFGLAAPQAAQVLQVYTYLALAGLSTLVPSALLAERSEATARLRDSESRFREIADHINEAFFVADIVERKTLYVNPGWATLWGRPIQDTYDPNTWFDSIHPDDRPTMAADMQRNAAGEATDTAFRIVRPDGALRWLRGRSFPVRDASGAVRRVVGLTADITELRESERRFVETQKLEAVGRLASGVAHDFNNLLTVIMGEAEELAIQITRPADQASVLEIRRASERASALTRQLLSFSQRRVTETAEFDVNAAISDAAKMLRRLIGEDVHLDLRLAPVPLGVSADRGQFEQVITNLVVNARDAMPDGGSILIATEASTAHSNGAAVDRGFGEVTVSVADTGAGMSPETIARAFEPFFTTKEPGRGTGLGLATCHDIITRCGGRVDVMSRLGHGTTMRVVLPRVTVGDEIPRVATQASVARGDECVLVVEDDTSVRRVTARFLRSRGYRVIEAHDATQALHQVHIAAARVDLLLTDIVLPGVSGHELARLIAPGHPGLKVLFVTGYVDGALHDRVSGWNADVLQKPFTSETLSAKVRELLDAPVNVAGEEA